MGATNIASKIAKNFGLKTFPLVPALAGIRYPENFEFDFSSLSGIAITAKAQIEKRQFTDQLLFTHRGFSGPLALNLSLFVNGKTQIIFNFLPEVDVENLIQKEKTSKKSLANILSEYLPKSFVKVLLKEKDYNLSQIKKSEIEEVAKTFNHFEIEVEKLDGFDKAEVTRGGISVDDIFPKTMETRKCPGLYFIGEALDVTGMLGGYNLHWAWASAKMFINEFCSGRPGDFDCSEAVVRYLVGSDKLDEAKQFIENLNLESLTDKQKLLDLLLQLASQANQ